MGSQRFENAWSISYEYLSGDLEPTKEEIIMLVHY